jgi:Flp pilus assembly protein TadB
VILPLSFLGVILLVDVAEFVDAFLWSASDPAWKTRWRALDPAESAWLAEMTRSRAWIGTLTDPEEVDLAKGFYRQERRFRVYFDLAALPFMVAAGVLALAGLLPISALGLVAGAFALIRGFALYLRERQIQKTYRQAKDNYLAMTTPESAPTA